MPDPAAGSAPHRARIEIVALGRGPRGFRSLRLDGAEQPGALLLMDLHSALRVCIGDRIYDEASADIRFVDD